MASKAGRKLAAGVAVAVIAGLSAVPASAAPRSTSTKIRQASGKAIVGSVKRAWRGRARITIRRLGGRGSRRIVSRVRRGRFRARLGGLRPGRYAARARYLGSRRSRPSVSRRRRFRVPAAPSRGCSLPAPGATEIGDLTLEGCRSVSQDRGLDPNPASLWGNVECQSGSRASLVAAGGDTHPTATGAPPGESSFRRLRVVDGDDFYGARCELGRNEHRFGSSGGRGTFRLYRQGERWVTFVSLRLEQSFPLATGRWQTVLQMKQAQPSAAGGGGPILELQAYRGRWWLINDWHEVWSAPARKGTWTRFAIDATYSRSAASGVIRVHVDANGDGDATDPGETSPALRLRTLKRETTGGWDGDGIAPGSSIPSHLRTGIYHDPAIACPPPQGCAIDVDNVQTVRAS